MLNYIKRIFTPKDVTDDTTIPDELLSAVDDFFKTYGNTGTGEDPDDMGEPIIYGNLDAKKTMLLMDDQETVFYLYSLDFDTIRELYDYDILSEFKIVKCCGPEAGFIASKYIRTCGDEIVVALLDLTLGRVLKLKNGETLLYDGVDVALEIISLHQKCKIGICTAHMITEANPVIKHLIDKFSAATGHNLLDYTFSKNGDRVKHLHRMLVDIEKNIYTDYGN